MNEAMSLNATEHEINNFTGKIQNTDTISYNISGKVFIVEPIFKKTSTETIGTILKKLITSDDEII